MSKIITNFTDFGNRKWIDRIPGGKADNKRPEDFNPDDIAIGSAVQREHTSNPDIATEISMDHLSENPEYYDRLIAAGISDEKDAINIYDELKDENDKDKAKKDILKNMEIDDEIEDDEVDNEENFDWNDEEDNIDDIEENDEDEDPLAGDRVIDQEDEMINDEDDDEKNITENFKNIKSFKDFFKS